MTFTLSSMLRLIRVWRTLKHLVGQVIMCRDVGSGIAEGIQEPVRSESLRQTEQPGEPRVEAVQVLLVTNKYLNSE